MLRGSARLMSQGRVLGLGRLLRRMHRLHVAEFDNELLLLCAERKGRSHQTTCCFHEQETRHHLYLLQFIIEIKSFD